MLIEDLYWKSHNISAVVQIGLAGIFYCLSQAMPMEPEPRDKLRSKAKAIAYNVGSFTWPGWKEPGIHPSDGELATGRDCARLNLRLGIELQKPPDKISMAHWLLGAHALAVKDADEAEKQFQAALDMTPVESGPTDSVQLNRGYLAVAKLCRNRADIAARSSFESIAGAFAKRDDEDSKTYLSQLNSARELFAP